MATKFDLFNSMVYGENDFVEKKILLNVTTAKKYINNKATDEMEGYKYSILVKGKVNDIVTVKIPSLLVNPFSFNSSGFTNRLGILTVTISFTFPFTNIEYL